MFCLSHKHSRYQNFHYGTRSPAFVQTIPSVSLASETRDHNRTRSAAGTRFPAGYSEYSAVLWNNEAALSSTARSTPFPDRYPPHSLDSIAAAAVRSRLSLAAAQLVFWDGFDTCSRDGASRVETADSEPARFASPSNAPLPKPHKSA